MARFISPITDMKPNGSISFKDANTNLDKITFKDELETIPNPLSVPVNANGNIENVFFSGSATVIYLDSDSVQYASRTPVGEEVGIGNFTEWSVNINYNKPDITIGSNDKFYQSIVDGNQGNDPTSSPTSWKEIRFIGVWNTNVTYEIGVVVQTTDGVLWRSLTATAGNNPSTDDGTNWAAQGLSSIVTPTNTTPADSATDVSSTPTLIASTFSSTNDIHLHSNWQITLATDPTFASPVFNVINSDLETTTVPTADKLDGEIEYIWRVRYIGVNGVSDFSAATSFTTEVALSSLFATTLGVGNTSTQQYITNLDFIAKDGVVFGKSRDNVTSHRVFDTIMGVGEYLETDTTAIQQTGATTLTSFNNDGFTLGADTVVNGTGDFVFCQFIEQPGFFEVVSFVGDGNASKVIPHSLGVLAGFLFVKNLDTANNWFVNHKDFTVNDQMQLNNNGAVSSDATIFPSLATTTDFEVGNGGNINVLNDNIRAYVFAHNPSMGIFCGSYVGTGAAGNKQTLGFPVGAIPFLKSEGVANWADIDIVRGGDALLNPDTNAAEQDLGASGLTFLSDGFEFEASSGIMNAVGVTYIFVAIADPAQF